MLFSQVPRCENFLAHFWNIFADSGPRFLVGGSLLPWFRLHLPSRANWSDASILLPLNKNSPATRTEADYFARNAERMRYPQFRRQHLFVGSGVIEAGCKTVIGSRLKRSGMFWTVRGANAILALRCCHLNRRFEDFWEGRRRLDFHLHVAHALVHS